MANGTINTLDLVQLPGLSSRATDYSMQMFIKDKPRVENVGHLTIQDRKFHIWIYNGTDNDISLTDLIADQAEGIDISGITVLDVIAARSATMVSITVTRFGPLEIAATIQFISTCLADPSLSIVGTRPYINPNQPRPIDLTTAMEEAYAYADGGTTFYDTLEFASTASPEKVLVVYSDEDLITPQGTFLPCKFECQLPETEGSVRGEMLVTVDFIPREAQIWLRETSQARGRLTVKWRQYLGPNLEPDAEYPIPLEIISVEQSPTGVTATALFPDIINMPFPRRIMTTKELPGGIV